MKNNNWLSILIFIAGLAFIGLWVSGKYNGLVQADENVENAWANVESAYQRRADLIPNLVNTVKGYADFEQETLTNVIEARSKATSTTVDPSNLTPEKIEAFQNAQNGLGTALSKLLVSVERYPDLKANTQFLKLQDQLEGTENRIKVERDRFNTEVSSFNQKVRSFPTNVIGGIFGFSRKGYFKADTGTQNAPNVEF